MKPTNTVTPNAASSTKRSSSADALASAAKLTLGALAGGLFLGGCSTVPVAGAFWGNLVVLGVTVGIFFGTLALGRSSTGATRSAEASTSSSGISSHGG